VSAEDRIEDLDKKEYRTQRKMLQGNFRYTVMTRRLAHFGSTDGVLNLFRVGQNRFAGWGLEV
jgi:hypothetical protein